MRGGRLVVVSTALSLSSSDSFPLYRSPSAILILMQFCFLFSIFLPFLYFLGNYRSSAFPPHTTAAAIVIQHGQCDLYRLVFGYDLHRR